MMELLLYETEFRFELPVAWGIFQRLKTLEENKEWLDPDVTSDFLGTMALVPESSLEAEKSVKSGSANFQSTAF